MPTYHFTIDDGSSVPQPEPIILPDIAAAKSEAIMLAGQMLKDADGTFWGESHWQINIETDDGLILASIHIDGFTAPAGE